MNNSTVIFRVYQKYQIPPNLQLHMLRAAAVGAVIVDNWKNQTPSNFPLSAGEQENSSPDKGRARGVFSLPNKDAIITVLLLHDTGNIIKFDLDTYAHFLGEEEKRLDYWKEVQKEFIKKYGKNEHEATIRIAKEIGISDLSQKVLEMKEKFHGEQILHGDDFNTKICSYADLRVAPLGTVSVNERFDDLHERYKGRDHPIADYDRTERNRKYCLEVEKQLQEMCSIELPTINDNTIAEYVEKLRNFEILNL